MGYIPVYIYIYYLNNRETGRSSYIPYAIEGIYPIVFAKGIRQVGAMNVQIKMNAMLVHAESRLFY